MVFNKDENEKCLLPKLSSFTFSKAVHRTGGVLSPNLTNKPTKKVLNFFEHLEIAI